MKNTNSQPELSFFRPDIQAPTLSIPFFSDSCAAGFPSPAQDFVEQELDLNALCIQHPAATFFVRASGNSMQELGLMDGDIMIVDRSEKAVHGDVVIAEIDGEFTVKRLQLLPRPALVPMNSAFPVMYPDELQLFGVVMHFVHSTRARR
ncbi:MULTISPECIES: translesion error-prone DNA polymerase V autoproteolytic subunit [unclassified Erwinia]|uniref:translesion error-prone DNA polymerase V autoproteolytic subunit n=1 Tax=unclassified Erwinia TaxID=2622719 RepID=UPI000C185678|nr:MULTISPECIES: translesion error-prone DNA polymerase V autoproteolytic subunit [unclassified Erwinia]PIJ52132.1 hypothetical protein BV501_00795 [Erwinia sp. OAMSP11]